MVGATLLGVHIGLRASRHDSSIYVDGTFYVRTLVDTRARAWLLQSSTNMCTVRASFKTNKKSAEKFKHPRFVSL